MKRADRIAWIALAILLAATAAFLFYETRHTTLWVDEWSWAVDRRGGGIDTLLDPHNQHLSLIPVLIYKALFAAAGLDDYTPYRACIVAAHLVCCLLLFVYARRRVGGLVALAVTAVMVMLGPAWQNIIWPFQVGSVISLAAGIAVLLALDREDRAGDIGACGLLALSIASSGNGLPIAIGVAVEVLFVRRRLRQLWIVAVPVVIYGIWWLAYQDAAFVRHNLVIAPRYAADAVAGALSALTGLTGPQVNGNAETADWGRPLALAAAALLVWRLVRRPVPGRAYTLLAVVVSFWILTGIQRAQFGAPDSGRYVYYGGLFLLLLVVELAQGVRISRVAGVAIACAALFSVVANFGALRDGGRFLRVQASGAMAVLGALEIARDQVPPGYVAAHMPGFPFLQLRADRYFAAADALGTPAASPAELRGLPEDARLAADAELTRIHDVALEPVGGEAAGSPPTVDSATGTTSTSGACVTFRQAVGGGELQLTLPPGGIRLVAAGGPVAVTVRRFAQTFPPTPLATLGPGEPAVLRIEGDGAGDRWHVRLAPQGRVTACGV